MASTHAFIFDMDGVLIDSNPFHKISLKQFCAKYGHDLTEDQLREKIYGRTNKDWIPNVFGPLPFDQIMAYQDEKEALFRDIYKNDIHEVAGLTLFLKKLDAYNIPRAIATSAPRANVDFTLEKTGTASFFPVILDESFVTRGKPDPEIYTKTVNALGMTPGNCVVFEDSLSGVAAGKAAGCKVVGITTTHTREELADTDLVIDDFRDLDPKSLISQLF
jgi:HAD superfamily hydrolase (TIGR01509 family)